MTRHQLERLEFLWLAGRTVREIGQELRVCKSTVYRHKRALGIPDRVSGLYLGTKKRARKDVWPVIFRWLKAGYTEAEIKKGLGWHGL